MTAETKTAKTPAKAAPAEKAPTTLDRKAYFKNYYKKNKSALSQQRRSRYKDDPVYREQHLRNTSKARKQKRVEDAPFKMKRDLTRSEQRFEGEPVPAFRLMQIRGKPSPCHTSLAFMRFLGRSQETLRRWLTEKVLPGVSYVDDGGDYWFTTEFCKVVRECLTEMYKQPRRRKDGLGDTKVLGPLIAKAFKAKGIKIQKVR